MAERKSTQRRGHGEGSIYQRESDGKWVGALQIDGKRRVLYGNTRKEVQEKLTALRKEAERGLDLGKGKQTVATYLEKWLEEVAKPGLRPGSYDSYAIMVRVHLVPAIGKIELAKLNPQHIQPMLNALRTTHSARTVEYARAILRRALSQAERWGLVTRNAAALTDPPRKERQERHPLTPEQAQAFLTHVAGRRPEALYRTAMATDMRQGELLGLRWEDIDFTTDVIHVRHSLQRIDGTYQLTDPKTTMSRRDIPLRPALASLLHAHRARQLEDRLRAGVGWQDKGLVFCTPLGMPLNRHNVTRDFKAALATAGLPEVPFHSLRHYFATALVAGGVPITDARDLLGHASVTTTLGVYAHARTDGKTAAMALVDAVVNGKAASNE